MHPGDLARGCSDLELTWLLCCAGAATAHMVVFHELCSAASSGLRERTNLSQCQ